MKKLTAIILMCLLIMTGCGNSDDTGNKAIDGDLELESNQTLVIAQVTAIYGNDITLAIAEKVDDSTTKAGKAQDSSTATDESANTQDTSTATDKVGNTNGSSAATNKSGASTGNRPSGGTGTSTGDTPSDSTDSLAEASSSDKGSKQSQKQMTRYQLTGEEMSATIPVGTPVTTLLGTVTTFSRIAVDNTLQIVMEKNEAGEDIIVEIYIVG